MTRTADTLFRERRRAARLAAIQALYAIEVSGGDVDWVVADFIERGWGSPDQPESVPPEADFLRILVEGVAGRRPELDSDIDSALAHGWTLARLEILLQAILRTGAYELSALAEVPKKVVINEYVEIAHAFFSGKEPGLVNAVLDQLAIRFRGQAAPHPGGAGGAGI
jgi:N utilization substance protein B